MLSCISRCGMSSADSANQLSSSRSMNQARLGRFIRRTATGSSQVLASRFRHQSSRVEFQRDRTGKITSLTWRTNGAPARVGRRVEIEIREDVRFSSGDIQLTGMVMGPHRGGKHPAIVLVHGSSAENLEYMLPWARFLIRRGMVVLGYDKRGVGGSTGDWNTASFDDLASGVVAAVENLKTPSDADRSQIGLLGISQAGC